MRSWKCNFHALINFWKVSLDLISFSPNLYKHVIGLLLNSSQFVFFQYLATYLQSWGFNVHGLHEFPLPTN